jgi:catechol 2,3-dioxygenase-like lactoylglutathione lyase family enzyme
MSFQGLHHLVLPVNSVPDGEQFYRDLFDMEVLFREGTLNDNRGIVPENMSWEDAIAANVTPYRSVLRRDDLVLAVAETTTDSFTRRFDQIALAVDRSDAESVAERASEAGCSVSRPNATHQIFIEDLYNIKWELNSASQQPRRTFDTLSI